MDDIAPELWAEIERIFREGVENDEKIGEILVKASNKLANHTDTQEYAIQIGEHASDALQNVLTSDALPDGKMYYNIAERTIRPQMELIREMVLEEADEIQETLNREARIGMKAVNPPANDDRIEGIINRICSEENFDKIKWILDAPIRAYAQSVVDDFIRANADVQSKAGLNPKIMRTLRGKGCKKCRELAGTYDYPDGLPEENVFMRHDNCKCLVTYDPGDGRRQNTHTKKWYASEQAAFEDRAGLLGLIDRSRKGEPSIEDMRRRISIYSSDDDNQGIIAEKIINKEISMKLSRQEYLKHVDGTKKFQEYAESRLAKGKGYQSRLNIDKDEAQELIWKHAGTGVFDFEKNTASEYVNADKIIGEYYSNDGRWIPTSRMMIIYKNKSAHIVPIKEKHV